MRRPWILLLAIPMWVIPGTAVNAAAPHIMLFQGSRLERPIVMADWQENHTVMGSLSEESAVKDRQITEREYLDVSLFWGPKWIEYKNRGWSVDALTQEQANQKARLYLASGDSPPILVFEGKAPRYVGPDGVQLLLKHGVPVTAVQGRQNSSLRVPVVIASTLALAGLVLMLIRRRRRPVIMTNVARQR